MCNNNYLEIINGNNYAIDKINKKEKHLADNICFFLITSRDEGYLSIKYPFIIVKIYCKFKIWG